MFVNDHVELDSEQVDPGGERTLPYPLRIRFYGKN